MVDVEEVCTALEKRISTAKLDVDEYADHSHIKIIQDPLFRRYKCYIDIEKAVQIFSNKG